MWWKEGEIWKKKIGVIIKIITLNNKVENLLIEFLDNYKDINNFVDLGCGAGNESIYLLKRGYKATSIDRQLNKDFILNRLTEEEKIM